MKLQILSTIVALSATAASADSLTCGQVKALYQDSTCCNAADASCVGSLTAGQGLALSGTGELSLVTGTTATTALAGNTVTISTLQSLAITETEDDVATLTSKMSTAETTIAAEAVKVVALEGEMSAAESTIVAEKAKVVTLEGKMNTAETTIVAEKAKVVTLEGKMSAAESTITAEKAKVVTLEGKMSTAESTIAAEEAKVTALGTRLNQEETRGVDRDTALGSKQATLTGVSNVPGLVDALATKQATITDGALSIAKTVGLQSALNSKQATITDGALSIANTVGLQSALNSKQATLTAVGEVPGLVNALSAKQATITDGALSIAKTGGLQSALNSKQATLTAVGEVPGLVNALSAKQATINNGALSIAQTGGLQSALNSKQATLTGVSSVPGLVNALAGHTTAIAAGNFASGLTVSSGGATIAGGLEVTGSVGTALAEGATHVLYKTMNTNGEGTDQVASWLPKEFGTGAHYALLPSFSSSATGLISASLAEGIVANNYYHNSDRRIKKDIVDADTGELLAKLNQLSMRKYGYITQGEDSETTVGWIAQEVADVDATYVNKVTKSIPDIGGIAVITTTGDGATTVRLPGVAIEVGEKLQVNSATGGAITVTVTSVADDDLVTFDREIAEEESESGIDENGDEVARVIQIYGHVVDDFHTLDKGRLLATAVGAIQELSTRLAAAGATRLAATEALDAKIAALEVRLAALE